ncbi:DUF896 domain-containing protein [Staphylococcus hyicus]
MLSQEKLQRINDLAKKKKSEGLTEDEAKEQSRLRSEYLASFRNSFKEQIEHTKVIAPEGNEVTHKKIKEIQKQKKTRRKLTLNTKKKISFILEYKGK